MSSIFSAAIAGGIVGVAGGWTLSFFRPDIASSAPGFYAAAGMGAIAFPLAIIPRLLINRLARDNAFFKDHPTLKEIFKDTASMLVATAGFVGAAMLTGAEILPTVASFMIIPTIFYALRMLTHAINSIDDRPAYQAVAP